MKKETQQSIIKQNSSKQNLNQQNLNQQNLTEGNIFKNLIIFSLPFLLSSFLQTFYGLADLFIAGQFYGSATITAVSIGSQIMHMITVIIVGLAMGTTVGIGRYIGAGKTDNVKKVIGNSIIIFLVFSVLLTIILLCSSNGIVRILSTPYEAIEETRKYVIICIAGSIFITAYNVISSIFRGLGDSKTPMYFVAISGVINIALDYVLMGPMQLGAMGAAIATVAAQGCSVIMAYLYARKKTGYFKLSKSDFILDKQLCNNIIRVGIPVAAQDGFIQISFLVITAIANMRGVDVAAAVGIVEKLISFMFLVPSAMLSAVSAISAQNAGAGKHERAKKTLLYGILCCVITGIIFTIICELGAEAVLYPFDKEEPVVVSLGAQYLRAYVTDCIVAGIHFCFSGYFCAYEKSILSFIHNVISIILIRIPGAYFASLYFPDSLFPMGLAAPLGSTLSAIICFIAFLLLFTKDKNFQDV